MRSEGVVGAPLAAPNSTLAEIASKVAAGERLSFEDGLALFESDDIFTIGRLAAQANERKNGDRVCFIHNRHINYSNVCKNSCKFCAFSKKEEDAGAYTMTIEEIMDKAREMKGRGGFETRPYFSELYGHLESKADRVRHMIHLREVQDETGGFQAFIPLAFHPKNTQLSDLHFTTGLDDLKTLAIARLMLDNFEHIKVFWIMTGLKVAQLSLLFGVDDIDGTVVEEKITHAAGAETSECLTIDELVRLIREAGKVPVERDTLYNLRRIYT